MSPLPDDNYEMLESIYITFLLAIAIMVFLAAMAVSKCFYYFLQRDIRHERMNGAPGSRGYETEVDLEWCVLPEDELPQSLLDELPPLYTIWYPYTKK